MPKSLPFPAALVLCLLAAPLTTVTYAQQNTDAQPPSPASTPGTSTPGTSNPPGVTATTSNPNLAVATIKLETGKRISQMIGATIYGQDGKELGKIDDLVMTSDDRVTLAVVGVGGFLGMGSKLVAFPFKAMTMEGDHWTLPGVTSETLSGMPNFQY